MKKAWRKLYRQELLFDFIMFEILILLCGGFLLYRIMKTANRPILIAGDIRLIGFSIAAIFIVILLFVIFLYKMSASYIRWYKGILDSIPMPVIVTDKDAIWQQANKAALEMMSLEHDGELGKLNSRPLIGEDSGVMKKTLTHNGAEYCTTGNSLLYNGKDTGYLIIFNNTNGPSCETRQELIKEINRLLGRLSTATDQFHNCASAFAGYSLRQAGIIKELSNVIVVMASGNLNEADTLKEKMSAVKADMEQHVESGQTNLETVIRELDATRDSIGNALHNINSVS